MVATANIIHYFTLYISPPPTSPVISTLYHLLPEQFHYNLHNYLQLASMKKLYVQQPQEWQSLLEIPAHGQKRLTVQFGLHACQLATALNLNP